MTVPATARRAGPYSGNGVTTSFSFSFKTFAAGDLIVTRTSSTGIETTLVLNSDYSVTLNPDQDASPGGSITYPISGSPLASGQKLTIASDLEYEQTTDLLGGGAFNARVIEDTFDRTVIQIQQLEERLDRAIVAKVSDTVVDMTLPSAANRANRYLSFDVQGRPVSTTFDIDAVQTASTAAVSAAAAAAQSEANAANAETVALAQAAFVASTVAATTPTVVNFSGDGATVAFTLPSSPGAEENTLVFIGGVYQQKTEYSVTGTTLTFTSAPPAGTDNIEVQIGPATNIAVNTSLGVSYLPAGTNAVTTTVQAKLRETVSVKDFGAVGDGVTDDTAAIYAAIQAATTGLVFEGTFLLSSPPPYTGAFTGAPNAYIPIINKNGFKIDASRATFITSYDFVSNTTSAALFAIVGSENVVIDAINCYAPSNTTSEFDYGINPLLVMDNGTTGSKNVYVSSIDCTNVESCIRSRMSGGDAEYFANGFNSPQRSSGIYVGNARMVNGPTLSKAGYGISLQLSGDNTVVDNARFINVHRSIIAYGVQVVKAKIWNTESAAANISIGSYGSITDFDIFLKDDGTDTTQAAAGNIAQISAYDIGTTGGSSIDIQAGRTHIIKNVKVEFDISVASRGALCYVGKEGDAVSDNNILIQNITLSGFSSGTSSGLRIAQSYNSPNPLWSNTIFDNIVVRDMNCFPSSQAVVRTGFRNALVFDNYIGNSIFGTYDGTINAYPIIYRNCTVSEITGPNHKNLYAVVENSHINRFGVSTPRIQPFNKQFINSRLGSTDPINKRQHDIYSDVNDPGFSHPLANPQTTKTNLVGGAFFEGNDTNNPIDLDLIAEPAATKPTSTTSRQIDHFSFTNTTDYVVTNSKLFNLYVRNTAGTIAAFYTGHLVLRGPARTDFNACTILLVDVSVTNLNGTSYLVGDLTVSAPDADTIRFSMSRASEMMNLVIYDN